MKTISILAVGLFPLTLAINQPKDQCVNFLTIDEAPQKYRYRRNALEEDSDLFLNNDSNRGRVRRGWFDSDDDDTSGDGDVTDSPVVTTAQTQPPTTETTTTSAANTDASTVDTDAPTTVAANTNDPATDATSAVNTPEPADPTEPAPSQSPASTESGTFPPTTVGGENNDKAIIVMLDETGSMQNINGKGRGREIVIRKMNKFRQMLKHEGNNQPITFITFNEQANWNSYASIDEWPTITKANYNPGYGTNLYDSMGCVLSEYRSRHPNQEVSLYLISDGIHQLGKMKRPLVAYREAEVKSMVEDLRVEGWDFYFYGATNDAKKDRLKTQAIDLGFRAAETLVFDFNGQQLGILLKTMFKNMVGKTEKINKQIPICEKCQKGPAGKMCRKARKNKVRAGVCIKA